MWQSSGGRWQSSGGGAAVAGGRVAVAWWQSSSGLWQSSDGRAAVACGRAAVACGRAAVAEQRWQLVCDYTTASPHGSRLPGTKVFQPQTIIGSVLEFGFDPQCPHLIQGIDDHVILMNLVDYRCI